MSAVFAGCDHSWRGASADGIGALQYSPHVESIRIRVIESQFVVFLFLFLLHLYILQVVHISPIA